MEAKRVADSRVTLSQLMGPQDANSLGNVHGGVIMKLVDEAGALAAMRHSQHMVVTVALDSMVFKEPILTRDVIILTAELTYVGRTSMEVAVEVITEDALHSTKKHTNSAYLVYVALDDNRRPVEVPPLRLETDEERARWKAAEARQKYRRSQQNEQKKASLLSNE
ncbi:MAG: acyl-CoA thioesterase [Anaerolineales bacterium]